MIFASDFRRLADNNIEKPGVLPAPGHVCSYFRLSLDRADLERLDERSQRGVHARRGRRFCRRGGSSGLGLGGARVVEHSEVEQAGLYGRLMRVVPFRDVFFGSPLVPFQRGLCDSHFRHSIRKLRSGNELDLAGYHRDFLTEGSDIFLGKTHVLSP